MDAGRVKPQTSIFTESQPLPLKTIKRKQTSSGHFFLSSWILPKCRSTAQTAFDCHFLFSLPYKATGSCVGFFVDLNMKGTFQPLGTDACIIKSTGIGHLCTARSRCSRASHHFQRESPKGVRFAFRPRLPGVKLQHCNHILLNVTDLSRKTIKKTPKPNHTHHKNQLSIYEICISCIWSYRLKYLLSLFLFHPNKGRFY